MLATKVHGAMGRDPNAQGNSRRWIMAECENSLRRLGTDYIDLYQIHRPSPDTDIDETLGALTDLVRSGKVRYVGSSTFPADDIVEAQWVAERRGREGFITEQPPYSIWCGGSKPTSFPDANSSACGCCRGARWPGVGCPAPSGRAGRTPADARPCCPTTTTWRNPATPRSSGGDPVYEFAGEAGLTLVELALGFVLEHPAVTSPIIGPRTMEHLESQLPAPDVRLSRTSSTASTRSCPRGPT